MSFQDKRVVYGLLAGAAVLVGAVLYHQYSSSDEPDMSESIGPLKRDQSGHIDFEQFIKIFEVSSAKAKVQFATKKKEYIEQRRKVLSDQEAYKRIVIQATQEEEGIINSNLQALLE